MNLLEKDIEDIIYNSPWLLDERYVIPKIKGSRDEFGRQINIGRNGLNRYIDLLFKDTRDNRPVIVELKKESLIRENIAQILEYRALVVSMDDENKIKWQNEFGQNYYCPKLILVGTSASEEVKISANLSGVEIRSLVGIEDLEVNFRDINDINDKLNNWNRFLNTGNRTLEDRDEWIEEIYDWIKDIVDEYGNEEVTTINKLCTTSSRNAWITDIVFPFINIPLYYKDRCLCGLYEYYDEEISFSDEYIYFDFAVQSIRYNEYENDEVLEEMENKVNELLINKEYNILNFEDGIATVKISRSILNDYNEFKDVLIPLIDDAVYINDEIIEIFGDIEE
ncbi:hypothetical protein FQB35_12865 [Crassaminicella thermophila]|uniref:DUF91 domain-containing protein n=1 Tax=Crassaminicella thermophila TaxID=2599308 RepID=A0A5C0SHH7_CRATE|nr:hypothetical protein [Crassaminicella thermophila]QEK13137.1 hypothetical protein FQB35_12865 [Crassaminicella thermophila]